MIEVKDLKKSYGKFPVLKGINMSIKEGEVYGLIGKNGAGKTTLMKILAGLIVQNSGTIEIKNANGENLRIGYLPDIPPFFEFLSTKEYLDFLLCNSDERREKDLLCFAHMQGNEIISSLSRGMKQRFGIAALLTNDPEVILLDEPTSALDPGGRADVHDMVLELKKQKKSIILSTHILNDMEKVCDRVGFLQGGIIKKEIDISKLVDKSLGIRVKFDSYTSLEGDFEGLSYNQVENTDEFLFNVEDLAAQKALFGSLKNCDARIVSIRTETVDLEKIFQEVCDA